MKKKIGVVSLGCPKNLVDTEVMLGLLSREDYTFTPDKEEADILIVNTCGFIESAKKESVDTILELAECKTKGKCQKLIVTGCLAERYREDILKEMPEVDAVIGTGNYEEIADIINRAYKGEKVVLYGKLDNNTDNYSFRKDSILKATAYLKVAEGCDNCCTYCIIPSLRGKYRSRKMESILDEAEIMASRGVKEVILVAQDTTRYGMDMYGKRKLSKLIQEIEKIEGIEWIRLLYCYPEEIDDELIETMRSSKKVCRYLDIPMQHASNPVLKRMGRRGTGEQNRELINKLRKSMPDITIRTSLIVGFPGETQDDFNTLEAFVEDMKFDRMGVFTYSKEEDTPAFEMEGQISARVKNQRQKRLMDLQSVISKEKNHNKMGKIYNVLVEGIAEDGIFYYGRTRADAPEIDGIFYMTSPYPLETGKIVKAKVLDTSNYDLTGEVTDESGK